MRSTLVFFLLKQNSDITSGRGKKTRFSSLTLVRRSAARCHCFAAQFCLRRKKEKTFGTSLVKELQFLLFFHTKRSAIPADKFVSFCSKQTLLKVGVSLGI